MRSHLINAVNIPLSQLRGRMDEIRKINRFISIAARHSVLTTPFAPFKERIHVYSTSRFILRISFYEYYRDLVTGRKPIVTDYNFD